MRLFVTADDFDTTVFGGSCALEMNTVEMRVWPSFRRIRKQARDARRQRDKEGGQ
jgi:hypothetical protein